MKKIFTNCFTILPFSLILGLLGTGSCSSSAPSNPPAKAAVTLEPSTAEIVAANRVFFEPVVQKMLKRGADTGFVNGFLRDSRLKFDEKLVKINVTGYRKPPDYSHNYNDASIAKAREFVGNHKELLEKAEKKYGVSKEAITAILWVETKFGTITGTHHVPSVYASIALADQPQYLQKNKEVLRTEFKEGSRELDSLDALVEKRAKRKADWAVGELLALEKMERKGNIRLTDLNGSWAGAFGFPQFLPSSYLSFAVDGDGDGNINLFTLEDAVASVGNYLKTNGWGESRKAQEKAVFHYNNSKDYVNAVLTLAEKISEPRATRRKK